MQNDIKIPLSPSGIHTERLFLIPYTIEICEDILSNNYSFLEKLNLQKGQSWPDEDVLETLPKIISNLSVNGYPTGFESWMIIKKDTKEIIGDAGFKGYIAQHQNVDLGYGIIKEERRQGFAEEAAKALIVFCFQHDSIKEITATCEKQNFASLKLLQKLHFNIVEENDSLFFWSLKK